MRYDTSDTTDEESCENRAGWYSRRRLLGASGAALASATAGCSSLGPDGSQSGSPDSQSDVFTDISFEGQQMVVELQEGHSVERLNLIGPDGSEFASTKVSEGVNSVEFELIDISPGISGFEHYEPGEYSIVAPTQDGSKKTKLSLQPSLQIISVSVSNEGPSEASDRLEVSVKNSGSGPTWIHDIGYSDLSAGQTSTPGEMPGLPKGDLRVPESAKESILTPGESQSFVSRDTPFVFEVRSVCQRSTLHGRVVAVSPVEAQDERSFRVELRGGATSTSPSSNRERYYCNSASASLNNSQNDG